jgi:hypothetical protein
VDQHRLGRHRPDAAVAQEPVDRRDITQGSSTVFHVSHPILLDVSFVYVKPNVAGF